MPGWNWEVGGWEDAFHHFLIFSIFCPEGLIGAQREQNCCFMSEICCLIHYSFGGDWQLRGGGSQSVKGELLTDKVNCCLALLLITIYVDNSWYSWRSRRFVMQGQPALPRPAPAVLGSWERPFPWHVGRDFVPREALSC